MSELIQPTRPPRTERHSWELADFPVRDFEDVRQENGLRAHFVSDTSKGEGWRFDCWLDDQNFVILEGDDQVGPFARLLLDSTPEKRGEREKQRREDQEEIRIARLAAGEADTPLMDFSKFVLPVFGSVANAPAMPDIVSVQPMAAPTSSVFKMEIKTVAAKEPVLPTVGPGETLHEYVYGGFLSERGGYFVTRDDEPRRVLRYNRTWMS